MAIEIRQLVIRAVVDEGARSSAPRSDAGPPSPTARPGTREHSDIASAHENLPGLGADERQAIVNACVREVLRKLERARER